MKTIWSAVIVLALALIVWVVLDDKDPPPITETTEGITTFENRPSLLPDGTVETRDEEGEVQKHQIADSDNVTAVITVRDRESSADSAKDGNVEDVFLVRLEERLWFPEFRTSTGLQITRSGTDYGHELDVYVQARSILGWDPGGVTAGIGLTVPPGLDDPVRAGPFLAWHPARVWGFEGGILATVQKKTGFTWDSDHIYSSNHWTEQLLV